MSNSQIQSTPPVVAVRRAVIYLRVSTNAQAEKDVDLEGYSLPAQREACHRKVKDLGGVVVAEYIDRGESAKTAMRPQFQRMLMEIRDLHDADLLVVHKLDRWARNRDDDVVVGLALKQMRVQLASATENIDDSPTGKLLRGLFASINEWYSDNLANEAIKGMTQKAKMGGTPGRAKVGYLNVRDRVNGYEVRTIAVDQQRAPHIIWAFETYAEGETSVRELAQKLERRGLRTQTTGKTGGKPIVPSHLHRILADRYYLGIVSFRGVEYEGRHQPLISRETFDRVQATLATRALAGDRAKRHFHYLKGTVYCARCGTKLGYSEARGGHGGVFPYFFCWQRHRKGSCDQPYIPAAAVEAAVLRYHRDIRPDPDVLPNLREDLLKAIRARQASRVADAKAQRKRIAGIEKRRTKLLEAFYGDAIDIDQLRAQSQRLSVELGAAQDILAVVDVDPADALRTLDDLIEIVATGADLYGQTGSLGRRLLNQFFFEKVYLDTDTVAGSSDSAVVGMLHQMALPADLRDGGNKKNPDTSVVTGFDLELHGGR